MRTPHLQLFLCCFFSRHNGLFLWRLSFCLPFCWVTERPLIFNHRLKLKSADSSRPFGDALRAFSEETLVIFFQLNCFTAKKRHFIFLWYPFNNFYILPAFSRAANKQWSRFIVTCCVSKGRSPGSSIVMWDHVRGKRFWQSPNWGQVTSFSQLEKLLQCKYTHHKNTYVLRSPTVKLHFITLSYGRSFHFFTHFLSLWSKVQTEHQKGERSDCNLVALLRQLSRSRSHKYFSDI